MTTLRALGREPARRGQPDAAASPGDDRDPARQAVCHMSSVPVARTGSVSSSVAMKTFFTSVNARGASGPSSRPRPDCLNPPNGVQ